MARKIWTSDHRVSTFLLVLFLTLALSAAYVRDNRKLLDRPTVKRSYVGLYLLCSGNRKNCPGGAKRDRHRYVTSDAVKRALGDDSRPQVQDPEYQWPLSASVVIPSLSTLLQPRDVAPRQDDGWDNSDYNTNTNTNNNSPTVGEDPRETRGTQEGRELLQEALASLLRRERHHRLLQQASSNR